MSQKHLKLKPAKYLISKHLQFLHKSTLPINYLKTEKKNNQISTHT
jgi:hypothetical protein